MEHQANTTPEAVPRRRWFIVLLILLGLAGIVIALLIPAVQAARGAAQRMTCCGRMNQLQLAFQNYHDTHGSFPPAYTVDENGKPLHSWRVLLLPYFYKQELYDKIRLDEPWDSEFNRQFHAIQIEPYQCPARRSTSSPRLRSVFVRDRDLLHMANCDYSVVIGEDTIFPGSKAVALDDVTHDPSNTILVVERMIPINWMDPNNEIRFEAAREGINRNLLGIGSEHPGGAIVSFASGRGYLFLSDDIDIEPLLTKSAGD